jgi:hypothetical protein
MAKSTTKISKEVQITAIQRLERATVQMCVLGSSSLVMNRMPAKAKQQLLLPRRTLNKAARESVLKHDPIAEFRDSVYRCREERAPTSRSFGQIPRELVIASRRVIPRLRSLSLMTFRRLRRISLRSVCRLTLRSAAASVSVMISSSQSSY